MLQWLNELFYVLAKIFPRLVIIPTTHEGVKFRYGSQVFRMEAGLHIYWPVVTTVTIYPVARQTCNPPTQVLVTKDFKTVCVSAILVYRVNDVIAAVAKSWDVEETIEDITMSSVVEVVASYTFDELVQLATTEVEQDLKRATRRRLRKYGVSVGKCALVDICETFSLRLISNG